MKFIFKIVLALSIVLLCNYAAEGKGIIPIGEQEYLKKVADLPDSEDYLIGDPAKVDSSNAKYVDLGILYRQYTIAFIPVWTTEAPKFIGYSEADKDIYYNLTDEQIEEIVTANNLNKDDLLSIGFFGKFGGKLIFIVLIGLILFGSLRSRN